MSVTTAILDIGSLATATGVGTAVVQLRMSRIQNRTEFEDSLTREYREIARELPIDVFLNKALSPEELSDHRNAFYRYFDLCNEQVFLRQTNRISRTTWEQWRDGITTNLGRQAFRDAWNLYFDADPDADFRELRLLMENDDAFRRHEEAPEQRPRRET
jgi:hypothetical protein